MALAERQLSIATAIMEEPHEPSPVLWTKEQSHQMGEIGLLDDVGVELIEEVTTPQT